MQDTTRLMTVNEIRNFFNLGVALAHHEISRPFEEKVDVIASHYREKLKSGMVHIVDEKEKERLAEAGVRILLLGFILPSLMTYSHEFMTMLLRGMANRIAIDGSLFDAE